MDSNIVALGDFQINLLAEKLTKALITGKSPYAANSLPFHKGKGELSIEIHGNGLEITDRIKNISLPHFYGLYFGWGHDFFYTEDDIVFSYGFKINKNATDDELWDLGMGNNVRHVRECFLELWSGYLFFDDSFEWVVCRGLELIFVYAPKYIMDKYYETAEVKLKEEKWFVDMLHDDEFRDFPVHVGRLIEVYNSKKT